MLPIPRCSHNISSYCGLLESPGKVFLSFKTREEVFYVIDTGLFILIIEYIK